MRPAFRNPILHPVICSSTCFDLTPTSSGTSPPAQHTHRPLSGQTNVSSLCHVKNRHLARTRTTLWNKLTILTVISLALPTLQAQASAYSPTLTNRLFPRQSAPVSSFDPSTSNVPEQCRGACTAIVATVNQKCSDVQCLCTPPNAFTLITCINCVVSVQPQTAVEGQQSLDMFSLICAAGGIPLPPQTVSGGITGTITATGSSPAPSGSTTSAHLFSFSSFRTVTLSVSATGGLTMSSTSPSSTSPSSTSSTSATTTHPPTGTPSSSTSLSASASATTSKSDAVELVWSGLFGLVAVVVISAVFVLL